MKNSCVVSRQHGLTLLQWTLLLVAFMVGLGGSFILREAFPSASAQASVVQAASVHSGSIR